MSEECVASVTRPMVGVAGHRRLLARYIRYHLGEGAELPALEFWTQRPWVAA